MPIHLTCPSCSAKLQAPDNLAGRKMKCPKCGTAVAVEPVSAELGPVRITWRPEKRPIPAIAVLFWALFLVWSAFLMLVFVTDFSRGDAAQQTAHAVQCLFLLAFGYTIARAMDALAR